MGDKKDYLIIGKVLKPFGISGKVKVLPITDSIERFKDITFVYLRRCGEYIKVPVRSSRITHRFVLLKLGEVSNKEDAEKYRNKYLYIDRENATKLPENSYYYYDLWKCLVVTTEGKEIGVVEDIQNAGSCDIYVVKVKDREDTVMIPAISDVVKGIDVKSKRIKVKLIEGLM